MIPVRYNQSLDDRRVGTRLRRNSFRHGYTLHIDSTGRPVATALLLLRSSGTYSTYVRRFYGAIYSI